MKCQGPGNYATVGEPGRF